MGDLLELKLHSNENQPLVTMTTTATAATTATATTMTTTTPTSISTSTSIPISTTTTTAALTTATTTSVPEACPPFPLIENDSLALGKKEEEDYPYNYPLAQLIKEKIYHTLKTVDLLRDELYQLKFNRLKHEEELIKKDIHPGFEIQQNSLKEELFNRIKCAKKIREASLHSIHKAYQTNLRLINNTFIDNKCKIKGELNRKIGHNYYQLMKEMRSYGRKRIMDKKKFNAYSLPKKGVLEAASVLATFSTPVIFNKGKKNSSSSGSSSGSTSYNPMKKVHHHYHHHHHYHRPLHPFPSSTSTTTSTATQASSSTSNSRRHELFTPYD